MGSMTDAYHTGMLLNTIVGKIDGDDVRITVVPKGKKAYARLLSPDGHEVVVQLTPMAVGDQVTVRGVKFVVVGEFDSVPVLRKVVESSYNAFKGTTCAVLTREWNMNSVSVFVGNDPLWPDKFMTFTDALSCASKRVEIGEDPHVWNAAIDVWYNVTSTGVFYSTGVKNVKLHDSIDLKKIRETVTNKRRL